MRRPRSGIDRTSTMTLALCLSCLSVGAASGARADDRDPSAAREAFAAGAQAADEARLDDARAHFETAYALSGNPAALFNVLRALFGTGRHLDAVRTADRLLAAHPDLAADLRAEATEIRRRAMARLARLVLLVPLVPPELTLAWRLDGAEARPEGAPPALRVDPGSHELTADAEGRRPFSWRGHLDEGQVQILRVSLPPLEDDDGVLWWSLGIGGAALAVAAGLLIGFLAQDAAQLSPTGPTVLRP